MKGVLLSIFFFSLSVGLFSQEIKGYVYEKETGVPLQYVSVYVKNTTIGTTTDENGFFKLNVKKLPCELVATFLGYTPYEKVISDQKTLEIYLDDDIQIIQEVLVKPDYSYDRMLMNKIIENRKHNNPDNLSNITYNDYSRTTIFLKGIDQKRVKKSKILSKSSSAFIQETDTTVRMPFLIMEQLQNHKRGKNAKDEEITMLSDTSAMIIKGISAEIKTVVLDKITTEMNFYENQLDVFTRGIPSPAGSASMLDYNIYLSDSVDIDGVRQYKFNFYPKSKRALTFEGYLWATSDVWALTEIHAIVPNSANINFVSDVVVDISYAKTDRGKWFTKAQSVRLNMTLVTRDSTSTKTQSFAVKKVNTFLVEPSVPGLSEYTDSISKEMIAEKLSQEEILSQIRPELDTFETQAYDGIKEFHNNGWFRFADKFTYMAMFGYYNLGYIDLGPHYLFFHNNMIEGARATIPLRTSSKVSKRFFVGGYVGYGFKNRQLAYGGSIAAKFGTKNRAVFTLNTRYDYFELTHNKFGEFTKEQPSQQGSGNFISSVTVYKRNPYMMRSRFFGLTYEQDFGTSVGLLVRPAVEIYENNEYLNFSHTSSDGSMPIETFTTYSMLINFRFSHDQTYEEDFFTRMYFGNGLPVYNLSAIAGYYDITTTGPRKYLLANFSLKQRRNISNKLMILYMVEVGGVVGKVPFPLLHMPQGSMDLGQARYHFNLLHHASFASDVYVHAHFNFSTYGIIFNHIPLIKKLKLRELYSFKIFYGKLLNPRHNEVMDMPDYMREPTLVPYMEGSVGIANLFKCFQIEYVFRINQSKEFDEFSARHGIRMRFAVGF